MSLNTANEELCAFLCYGKHNSTGRDKKVAVAVLGPGSASLPAKRPPVDAERNESNRKLPLLNRQSDDGFREEHPTKAKAGAKRRKPFRRLEYPHGVKMSHRSPRINHGGTKLPYNAVICPRMP